MGIFHIIRSNVYIIKFVEYIMSEDLDKYIPDWEKITKLSDIIDKSIDEAIIKDEMSFIEIDISLLMIHEKLTQEKNKVMAFMLQHEETVESKPHDIYK